MAAKPSNVSCDGDLQCDICVGAFSYKWRQAYLVPQVRINMGIIAAASAVTCPVTVGLNGLAIYTILSNPALRNIPVNLTVALLSITDFLVSITTQPLLIGILICRMSGHCQSCIFVQMYYNLLIFFSIASIYHLAIISADRLIAVKFPYRHRTLVTSRKIVFSSILVWSYSLLSCCSILFTGLLLDQHKADIVGYSFFVLDVIVVFIVVASYVAIYLKAKGSAKNIQKEIAKPQKSSPKETFKGTKTTFMVTCSVLGTYVINMIVIDCIFYEFPASKSMFNAKIYFSLMYWTVFILTSSSLINPFIYILSSKRFTKELKKKLGLKITKIAPQQNFELQTRCTKITPAAPTLSISHLTGSKP